VGQTAFSTAARESEVELAVSAIGAAAADAGADLGDIDGIVRFSLDPVAPHDLLRAAPIDRLRFYGEIPYGGTAACATVTHAAAAVSSGLAELVVCYRALKGRSGTRFGRAERTIEETERGPIASGNTIPGGALSAPFGLLAPAQGMALWASRYRHVHGIEPTRFEQALGTIAVTFRTHAQANPNAVTHGQPLELDAYLASPTHASPLRRLDLCRETDGAVAILVGRVTAASRPAVGIRAATQSLLPYGEPVPAYTPDITRHLPGDVVRDVLARSEITLDDVDVLGVYDATTFSVIAAIEDLGFCGRGEGVDFVLDGALGSDASLPTNTSGGLLSEGYIHGMNVIAEVVRQLRGDAGLALPRAPQVGLVHSRSSVLVLGR
jgi:acetyl-CoA acetyltransferase